MQYYSAMDEDFTFVSTLNKQHEWFPLEGVNPGTHTDCILKETMRPYDRFAGHELHIPDEEFIFFNSFTDIIPSMGREITKKAWGLFIRGEFLTLRALTLDHELPLHPSLEEEIQMVIDGISQSGPQIIYLRLMDYNTDEYKFLKIKPGDTSRGIARLLQDDDLLEHELAKVRRFKQNGIKVRVVLPYITSPEEQEQITKIVAREEPDQIGVIIERVAHAKDLENYPKSDFLMPGPSDLTADYHSIKRGNYRDKEDNEAIIEIAQEIADAGARMGIRDYVACKILVNRITPGPEQRIYNAYMPNQLFVAA